MEKPASMPALDQKLHERLERSGLRLTPHRQLVYGVLLERRDHPTAEEVFIRAKPAMAEISLATVYNCLEALVQCGLVRQVNLDRAPTRYCSNMQEHYHFYCDDCGGAYDIDLPPNSPKPEVTVPKGFKPGRYEVVIRGLCPPCAGAHPKRRS